MEVSEERISEMEHKTIERTESLQHGEDRLQGKANRTSGAYGTVTNYLVFASLESQC